MEKRLGKSKSHLKQSSTDTLGLMTLLYYQMYQCNVLMQNFILIYNRSTNIS